VIERPIGVLVVEDNKYEVQAIKNFAEDKKQFKILGVADNTNDAMKLVLDTHPDIIVLDFALRASVGSILIESVRATELSIQPYIIVISNAIDDSTKASLIDLGANICLIKGDVTENPRQIFHCIESFFGNYLKRTGQESQIKLEVVTEVDKRKRLESRINKDFQRMGFTLGKPSYKYIRDIIVTCVVNKDDNPIMINLYAEIGKQHGIEASAIDRAIDRGIMKAFSDNYYDETTQLYTAEYGKNRDKPSVREFICHFVKMYVDEGY